MVIVKSYLKDGDEFVPAEAFGGRLKDPDYIEGAIELSVNGIVLIDKSMWDYVDQLWSYLIDGLSAGGEFSTYFPDQPIQVSVEPIYGDNLKVTVRCHEDVSAIVSKQELTEAIKASAIPFLKALSEIAPSNADAYGDMISSLESM